MTNATIVYLEELTNKARNNKLKGVVLFVSDDTGFYVATSGSMYKNPENALEALSEIERTIKNKVKSSLCC